MIKPKWLTFQNPFSSGEPLYAFVAPRHGPSAPPGGGSEGVGLEIPLVVAGTDCHISVTTQCDKRLAIQRSWLHIGPVSRLGKRGDFGGRCRGLHAPNCAQSRKWGRSSAGRASRSQC